MADSKITALTAISTVDPTADPLVIVDVSDTSMAASGTTKKSTINQLLGSGGTATLASATITGDLTVRTNKLFVNATGVGIGTTTVNGDLTIQNGSNCRMEVSSSATGTVIENLNNARNAYLNMTMYADAYIWNRLGSEAMRLNSTGLGVGVASPTAKLHISGNFKIDGATSEILMATGSERTISASGSSGSTALTFKRWNGSSYVSDVVFDGSSNVGVGLTPSAWNSNYKALQIGLAGAVFNDNFNEALNVSSNAYYDSVDNRYEFIRTGYAQRYTQTNGGQHQWHTSTTSGSANNAITFNQAMTLDASGNLSVGATSVLNGVRIFGERSGGSVAGFNRTTSDGTNVLFYREGLIVGDISVTTLATTYNSISDYRLKEAVQPLSGGLARVNALKPSIYKWKVNGSSGEGFLAHELAEVVPASVTGEKDAVNEDGSIKAQSIDMSRIVPILVAAIQELTAEVNALKNA
jgi:hypothetical protein